LSLDLDNFLVLKNNQEIKLTSKEFQILKLFLTQPNQVYSLVWEDEYYGDENVINVHMRRIFESKGV